MNASNPANITLLIFVPLIAWRIYKRFKRLVGRQRLSKVRLWITLGIYTMLLALLFLAGLTAPILLFWLVGSVGLGALLGWFGLSKTVFEPTKEGLFYTPNAHLGIALSMLFVARLGYRFFQIYAANDSAPPQGNDFAHSSLTLAVFGLLAGYYVTYDLGLLRWRHKVLLAKRQREAANAQKIDLGAGQQPDDHAPTVPPKLDH